MARLSTLAACHRTPLEVMGAAETRSRRQYMRCRTISTALLDTYLSLACTQRTA